jgi:hypothetical protein
MSSEAHERLAFLTLITGRNRKDAILTDLHDMDIRVINSLYGRGTVKADLLRDILGLVPEEQKVIIVCVAHYFKIEAVLKLLSLKYDFNRPNKGIAFTMPVDGLSF